MHAYLLISQNQNPDGRINELAKKINAKIVEFPLIKIEDARNLNNLIRLSFEEPTLIVSKNIHEATEEALNAFLKNLEEPQENVYFALTATSVKKVLPTIVSRSQIITITGGEESVKNEEEMQKFINMSVGEKLNYISPFKEREKALELVENTVNFLHDKIHKISSHTDSKLHSDKVKYSVVAENLEEATKTYSRLKGNGNVNLQLVNFVINLRND